MRVLIKNGDLLMDSRTSRTYVAQSDVFTKRYFDASDHDMLDNGMGHLAGTYESAVKVLSMDDGKVAIWRLLHWRRHITNLTAQGEETTNSAEREEERRLS